MRSLRREFYNVSTADEFRVVPLGDIHLGAAACDEGLLRATVQRIADDPHCHWGGMGDYCDFVNRSDIRFDPLALAPWITVKDLADLPRAQVSRMLKILEPIAHKCLWMLAGNHEHTIHRHYERDVYSELVTGIKVAAGWPADYPLALGYEGWVRLAFYWSSDRKGGSAVLDVKLHHGFGNGRKDGGKTNVLHDFLDRHNCDLALMGHNHSRIGTQSDDETLNKAGVPEYRTKKGSFTGGFLGLVTEADTYVTRAGYAHAPTGTITVTLRPGADRQPDRVRITA